MVTTDRVLSYEGCTKEWERKLRGLVQTMLTETVVESHHLLPCMHVLQGMDARMH